MKRATSYSFILFYLLIVFSCTSCAPPPQGIVPFRTASNQRGFYVKTFFDALQRKELAQQTLKKESDRLCPDGYEVESVEEVPRRTSYGSPNGQVDIFWEIICK